MAKKAAAKKKQAEAVEPGDSPILDLTDADDLQKVTIPDDCLAIQMGECLQIVTGGAVTATPHCVRGASVPNIARISLPCFVDTPPTFALLTPPEASREQVLKAGNSSRVPPLGSRWADDQTFGEFLQVTFAKYYEWNKK